MFQVQVSQICSSDLNEKSVGNDDISDVPNSEVPTSEVPSSEVPSSEVPSSDVPASEEERMAYLLSNDDDDDGRTSPYSSDIASDLEMKVDGLAAVLGTTGNTSGKHFGKYFEKIDSATNCSKTVKFRLELMDSPVHGRWSKNPAAATRLGARVRLERYVFEFGLVGKGESCTRKGHNMCGTSGFFQG